MCSLQAGLKGIYKLEGFGCNATGIPERDASFYYTQIK